jgi:hypothetical protein
MRKFLFFLFAITLGIGVAIFRIANIENSDAFFHNGSWIGSNSLPLGKNNLVTAQITVFGLFALPSEEAIYLFARRDDKNELLSGDADYEIFGNINQMKAKYWSITIYGKDLYLIENEVDKFSFNQSNVQADSLGNFSILVSAKRHERNWLPSKSNGRFNLVLRIYDGEKQFISNLEQADLPKIKQI